MRRRRISVSGTPGSAVSLRSNSIALPPVLGEDRAFIKPPFGGKTFPAARNLSPVAGIATGGTRKSQKGCRRARRVFCPNRFRRASPQDHPLSEIGCVVNFLRRRPPNSTGRTVRKLFGKE